jgi:hypothetical protein
MPLTVFLLCAALFLSLGGPAAYAQQKYALVIGNGAYTNVTRLNNPVNDARDMKAALESLGFTVDLVVNGALDQMESAAMRLKSRLSAAQNSYGFFFYAGHAVQSGSENYLIPVDANIQSENFLRQKAVSMQAVLGELNDAGNALNIVVLDACRDNPFSWKRSGSRGLRVVSDQPADSIIVYATSAGNTANDNPSGRNGFFTTYLLANLKTPGLSVQELFNRTGADVRRASGGKQIPAIYSQYFETAYLGGRSAVTVQPAPDPQPTPKPTPATVKPAPAPRPATVQPTSKPSNIQTDLSGVWNVMDVTLVCDSLSVSFLQSPQVANFIARKGELPVILVRSFQNESSEHIDTSIITTIMEQTISKSGKALTRVSSREPDFLLTGTVKSIVDRDGKTAVKTYFISAELTDIATNARLWIGQNSEIKKLIVR